MAQEKRFEEQLKRWLESQGIYALGTEKQKMTVKPCGYYEKRHGSMYTKSGLPDMHIIVNGYSLEVELKAPRGKPSALQIQKINQIKESGCYALIAYPKDFDLIKTIVISLKGLKNPYA